MGRQIVDEKHIDVSNDIMSVARRIHSLVRTDWFHGVYTKVPDKEKKDILDHMNKLDIEYLLSLRTKRTNLEQQTYMQIRGTAQKLKILNYSRKTKKMLIQEILQYGKDRANGKDTNEKDTNEKDYDKS